MLHLSYMKFPSVKLQQTVLSVYVLTMVSETYTSETSRYCNDENYILQQQTLWPESESELYQPSNRRLSAKIVPTFADIGCHVVSITDPYDRILGFLDRRRSFFSNSSSMMESTLSTKKHTS
jgi:hypothetical protein